VPVRRSTEQGKEEEMAMIDYGRQAPAWRVKLMVDTGVRIH